MDEDLSIFKDADTQQLNKFAKRIITARILIFILAVISLFMSSIGFLSLELQHEEEREDAIVLLIFFGTISLIYFVSGVISIRKPFTSFILATIITVLFLMFFIYAGLSGLLYESSLSEISGYFITVLLLLAIIFFIARGILYAKKHKKLTLTCL